MTALTAASTSGTGTVLTNLSYSGSTVTATKGYPPLSISYTGSGNAIDGLSYSNGTITANKTNISGGTSFNYSFESLGTLTSYGTNTQKSITTNKNGIIFIRVSTIITDVHIAKITIGNVDFGIEVDDARVNCISWYAPAGTTITCWRGDTKAGSNPHVFNIYRLTFS